MMIHSGSGPSGVPYTGQAQPMNTAMSMPNAPTHPTQFISHEAAGVQLGCASCVSSHVNLRDAVPVFPMWAKALVGISVLGCFALIVLAVAKAN